MKKKMMKKIFIWLRKKTIIHDIIQSITNRARLPENPEVNLLATQTQTTV